MPFYYGSIRVIDRVSDAKMIIGVALFCPNGTKARFKPVLSPFKPRFGRLWCIYRINDGQRPTKCKWDALTLWQHCLPAKIFGLLCRESRLIIGDPLLSFPLSKDACESVQDALWRFRGCRGSGSCCQANHGINARFQSRQAGNNETRLTPFIKPPKSGLKRLRTCIEWDKWGATTTSPPYGTWDVSENNPLFKGAEGGFWYRKTSPFYAYMGTCDKNKNATRYLIGVAFQVWIWPKNGTNRPKKGVCPYVYLSF